MADISPPPRSQSIAIIGGGLSGTLLAINLLHNGCPHVQLVERDTEKLARGLAFGTDNPRHLLNVRVSNMSAFPDQPEHFAEWLGLSGSGASPGAAPNGQNRFVERRTYGAYVRHLLDEAQAAYPDRLTIVDGEAVAASVDSSGWRIDLAGAPSIRADIMILAQGNMPPMPLPHFGALAAPSYLADPWVGDLGAGLTQDDTVLVIGTGLTAIDVVLTLDEQGFRGKVIAMSRRGLRPRGHAPVGPHAAPTERPPVDGSALVRHVRLRAREVGWRTAVDELRPHTQALWRRMDMAARRRFLCHLRPFWDVHRHRLAPAVELRVDALQMENRLRFLAGKVTDARPEEELVRVTWRPRSVATTSSTLVKRIINCTGPAADILQCTAPLITDLHRQGLIAPDPLRLGIAANASGNVQMTDGRHRDDLFAVGPITRSECWEIVAVPDIRQQVWTLARNLSRIHWAHGRSV